MTMIRITKEFRFEAAHALEGYDGPCKDIHGHSYELSVTLSGIPVEDPDSPKRGMVMDFRDLKKIIKDNIIDPFDHSLILGSEYNADNLRKMGDAFGKVMIIDYQPTSENMVIDFAGRIKDVLPPYVKLHCLRLRETATSYAEWFAADNEKPR